jgi:chromosome partitioning protein
LRDRPEHVITVFAPKGGVGKTTIASNLLTAACMEGLDAIGVDLDAQTSLTTWADIRARQNHRPEIRVLAASPSEWPEVRRATVKHQLLVVDTPPGLDDDERLAAVRMLLRDSDLVLVPTQPYPATLLKLLEIGLTLRSRSGNRAVFVLNQVIAGRAVLREAREWLAQHGAELCPVEIPLRDHVARAAGLGLAAVEFDVRQGGAAPLRTLWRFAASRLGFLALEAA